jgi:hypothetical protein
MKPLKNLDSADSALILKNAIWAFPYLAVMGLIWGYLARGFFGAVVGLVVAFLVSAAIGSASLAVTGRIGEGGVNTPYGLGRTTIGIREPKQKNHRQSRTDGRRPECGEISQIM